MVNFKWVISLTSMGLFMSLNACLNQELNLLGYPFSLHRADSVQTLKLSKWNFAKQSSLGIQSSLFSLPLKFLCNHHITEIVQEDSSTFNCFLNLHRDHHVAIFSDNPVIGIVTLPGFNQKAGGLLVRLLVSFLF